MKKLILGISLLLLLVGCSQNKYTIEGEYHDESVNGKTVFLFMADNPKVAIDSAVISKNFFHMKGDIDSAVLCQLRGPEFDILFVLEPGHIKINIGEEYNTLSGTPMNNALNTVSQANDSLYQIYQQKSGEIMSREIADSIKRIQMEEMIAPIQAGIQNNFENAFTINNNNVLGSYLFTTMAANMNTEGIDSLYKQSGPVVQNSPIVIKVMKENESLKNTSAGKMFVNFTIPNGNIDGTPASLSDYVGKGKYVLVDFWASWCGPCRREVPNLKHIYDMYKGDNFELLGVAVWDQRAKSLEAIEKLGMTWPEIIDAGTIPTDLYGIKGIPQIMLFAPDGTIVARDLRGQEIETLLAKELKK